MRIYRLTPIKLDHHDWTHIRYKDTVIVRAKDEVEARKIVPVEFRSTLSRPTWDTLLSPWINEALVKCEEDTNGTYSISEKAAVLYPEDFEIDD